MRDGSRRRLHLGTMFVDHDPRLCSVVWDAVERERNDSNDTRTVIHRPGSDGETREKERKRIPESADNDDPIDVIMSLTRVRLDSQE